jgi:ClpP class serine protease
MVVQRAKSAATMICLGSDQIYMTKTSELGPIDPQIFGFDKSQRISVDSYIGAYDKLMNDLRALDMNEENPSGLLHQLNRFDTAHVEEMRKARDLGRDMAEKFLNEFMLKGATKEKIDEVVQAFSESAKHKSHGRPIWATEAKALGLNIVIMNPTSNVWKASYELLQRYDHLCMLRALSENEITSKILETTATSHSAAVGAGEEG